MSEGEETTPEVPAVEITDLQDVARRWAQARREARRWAGEADRLGEQLLPAMETSDMHGVTGEDWIVRVARRRRYYGASPERLREILGPMEAVPYIRTVIDWAALVADYGEGVVERLGASHAETAYLALGSPRKEEPEE